MTEEEQAEWTLLRETLASMLPAYLDTSEHALCNRICSQIRHGSASSTPLPRQETAFLTSELCDRHDIADHPECAHRSRLVRERVVTEFASALTVVSTIPLATREQLLRFHTPRHVDRMQALFQRCHEGKGGATTTTLSLLASHNVQIDIDDDTAVMRHTEMAALTAAGAVCHAIDLVMSDSNAIVNAFCGVRPPGHHAEPHRAMGFCLFNNVGVGACHLLTHYAAQIHKILILDFDVHHGNGTQAKFYDDHPGICFISMHQGRFYPHTGKAHERGSHDNMVNVPLRAKTSSQAYRRSFEKHVLPAMHAFAPDFVLVSAGFDAHRLDPLAEIALETADYYWITRQVTDVARKHAQGRIVSTLEGGYHLEALADSAAAHVRALVQASRGNPHGSTEDDVIDQLSSEVASMMTQDLRLTIHYNAKEKALVLPAANANLLSLCKLCKNKFNLKKRPQAITLQDAHGTTLTDRLVETLVSDQHLYIR